MGSQKKEAILQAKVGSLYISQKKMGEEWALSFWLQLLPAKFIDLL